MKNKDFVRKALALESNNKEQFVSKTIRSAAVKNENGEPDTPLYAMGKYQDKIPVYMPGRILWE